MESCDLRSLSAQGGVTLSRHRHTELKMFKICFTQKITEHLESSNFGNPEGDSISSIMLGWGKEIGDAKYLAIIHT